MKTSTGIEYAVAIWDGNTLINADQAPLWSGRGEAPAIGSTVLTSWNTCAVCVTGYFVAHNWLMLEGTTDDGTIFNLAGMETEPLQEA